MVIKFDTWSVFEFREFGFQLSKFVSVTGIHCFIDLIKQIFWYQYDSPNRKNNILKNKMYLRVQIVDLRLRIITGRLLLELFLQIFDFYNSYTIEERTKKYKNYKIII